MCPSGRLIQLLVPGDYTQRSPLALVAISRSVLVSSASSASLIHPHLAVTSMAVERVPVVPLVDWVQRHEGRPAYVESSGLIRVDRAGGLLGVLY